MSKIKEIINDFTDIITLINNNLQIEILKFILLKGKEKKVFDSIFKHSFNNKIGNSLIEVLLKPFQKKTGHLKAADYLNHDFTVNKFS